MPVTHVTYDMRYVFSRPNVVRSSSIIYMKLNFNDGIAEKTCIAFIIMLSSTVIAW